MLGVPGSWVYQRSRQGLNPTVDLAAERRESSKDEISRPARRNCGHERLPTGRPVSYPPPTAEDGEERTR
jgi:hypothetical protein